MCRVYLQIKLLGRIAGGYCHYAAAGANTSSGKAQPNATGNPMHGGTPLWERRRQRLIRMRGGCGDHAPLEQEEGACGVQTSEDGSPRISFRR